jgi:hypothetical protein
MDGDYIFMNENKRQFDFFSKNCYDEKKPGQKEYIYTKPTIQKGRTQSEKLGCKSSNVPLLCLSCFKTFPYVYYLESHMRSHMKLRQFKCEYENCKKSYKYKKGLIFHVKTVHKNLVFKCGYCSKDFKHKHSNKCIFTFNRSNNS